MYVRTTISFESLDQESSFLVCGYIFWEYGSSWCMKVLRSKRLLRIIELRLSEIRHKSNKCRKVNTEKYKESKTQKNAIDTWSCG